MTSTAHICEVRSTRASSKSFESPTLISTEGSDSIFAAFFVLSISTRQNPGTADERSRSYRSSRRNRRSIHGVSTACFSNASPLFALPRNWVRISNLDLTGPSGRSFVGAWKGVGKSPPRCAPARHAIHRRRPFKNISKKVKIVLQASGTFLNPVP